MSDRTTYSVYSIYCDGVRVAKVDAPSRDAAREAMHYAAQYEEEGVVVVKRGRRIVSAGELFVAANASEVKP